MSIPASDIHAEDLPPEWDDTPDDDGEMTAARFLDAELGDFLNRPKTAVARHYEKKTAGALNAFLRQRAASPTLTGAADAATVIAYGDGFASAAGRLAEEAEWARKAIDVISEPSNPAFLFAMAAIPLVAQLVRNHEPQIEKAGATWKQRRKERKERREKGVSGPPVPMPTIEFGIPRTNKKIRVRVPFRLKLRLSMLTAQAVPPEVLTSNVYSNPLVQKRLKKAGIDIAGYHG